MKTTLFVWKARNLNLWPQRSKVLSWGMALQESKGQDKRSSSQRAVSQLWHHGMNSNNARASTLTTCLILFSVFEYLRVKNFRLWVFFCLVSAPNLQEKTVDLVSERLSERWAAFASIKSYNVWFCDVTVRSPLSRFNLSDIKRPQGAVMERYSSHISPDWNHFCEWPFNSEATWLIKSRRWTYKL